MLNRNNGDFMRLKPDELDAEHECLAWCRQDDINAVFTFFGTTFEAFHRACSELMTKIRRADGPKRRLRIKPVIDGGSLRVRICASRTESRVSKEVALGETLGDDAHAMVVVDAGGYPLTYDALTVIESVAAKRSVRLEIEQLGPGGRGWARANAVIDTDEFGEAWRTDIATGAKHICGETWVKSDDPHYDAMCWPCVHPYGTGSMLLEPGSGGAQRYARNRLCLIQSWFRRSALWGFWFLDRFIKTELFLKNRKRRETGREHVPDLGRDPHKCLFGVAQPCDIPETRAWWERQQDDLFAMSDDPELGLMQSMLTVTANYSSPEMLAAIRRGPFAELIMCFAGVHAVLL